ncbi:hypothetical protein B1813_19725 [Saccharomonospora piscinae]|uniref:DUF6801 domain-containing protein n=1 Tax=Saccharomonospora piscinae TaxID=687388 RepID=A0A1V8ZZE9_SACPI|nr:DUF6801 domain-containing protein [Saccharomonospora piscinae]OQO90151.1 hypothetical protein B1813_19725 [Saccharomonospora piscinae]
MRVASGRAVPAVAVAVVGLTGILATPAASKQDTGPRSDVVHADGSALPFRCETEGGEREVSVRFGLSLPERVPIGEPVTPEDVTVEVTLGDEATADLTGRDMPSVTGSAEVVLAAANEDRETDEVPLVWPTLAVPATPVPEQGRAEVTARGKAPSFTPEQAGRWTLSAREVTLYLATPPPDGDAPGPDPIPEPEPEPSGENDAGSAAEEPGSAADTSAPSSTTDTEVPPASPQRALTLDCALAPDAAADPLLSWHVAEDGENGEAGEVEGRDGTGSPPGEADGTTDALAEAADVPEDCEDFADEPTAWCAYLGGFNNINAMGSAARIEPGILNLAVPNPGPCPDGPPLWFCQNVTGELSHDGKQEFPPSDNAFHAFDFMPNAATVEVSQVAPMDIEVQFQIVAPYEGSVVARTEMSVRADDVTVNGKRLDVGEDCRTAEPMPVTLTADYPDGYVVDRGGTLDGTVDIPEFAGCGRAGELDSLITGLISGPGNYVKMTQGSVCDVRNTGGCPPPIPTLAR